MSTSWSEDRVALLKTLWLGGCSASQVAKALGGGVTRNAVIGKVHRLGLSGRVVPSAPGRASPARSRLSRPKPAAPRVKAPPPPPLPKAAPAAPPLAEETGLARDVVGLRAHACRWPLGDPRSPSFSFCGRPGRGSYCEHHAALSVRPGSAWRADKDPAVRRALESRP